MGKYEPLGFFLSEIDAEQIPMTFDEVEEIIGSPLPESQIYPAWWSNNESNNVMTKVWLAAGFRTEQVDIAGRKLIFRKIEAPSASARTARGAAGKSAASERTAGDRHPLIGCLKGLITIAPGTDLTQPADPEWMDLLDKDDLHRRNVD